MLEMYAPRGWLCHLGLTRAAASVKKCTSHLQGHLAHVSLLVTGILKESSSGGSKQPHLTYLPETTPLPVVYFIKPLFLRGRWISHDLNNVLFLGTCIWKNIGFTQNGFIRAEPACKVYKPRIELIQNPLYIIYNMGFEEPGSSVTGSSH